VKRENNVAVALMFLGYSAGLMLWLTEVIGNFFLPPIVPGIAGMFLSTLLAPVIILWAIWPSARRRSKRLWSGGLALVLGVVAFGYYAPARRMSNSLYARTHGAVLEHFAAEIRDYGRIRVMSQGDQSSRFLNGTDVVYTEAGRDSVYGYDLRPLLATVLERDSIDPRKYNEFRGRLRDLHFFSFHLNERYVMFLRRRDSGLLVAFERAPPFSVGQTVPGTDMRITQVLGDRLYCFHIR
jgi:hypothetical protein